MNPSLHICPCSHEPQLWELLGIVLRAGTESSMLWSRWFTGPCVTGGGGGVVSGGQWRSVVTVRKGALPFIYST